MKHVSSYLDLKSDRAGDLEQLDTFAEIAMQQILKYWFYVGVSFDDARAEELGRYSYDYAHVMMEARRRQHEAWGKE